MKYYSDGVRRRQHAVVLQPGVGADQQLGEDMQILCGHLPYKLVSRIL